MREEEYRQRLQNLEEKFSWQEETVDQLSEILREQQQQLEKLAEELVRLRSLVDCSREQDLTQKPPHY